MPSSQNSQIKQGKIDLWSAIGWASGLGLLALTVWLFTLPKIPTEQIASATAIHWHPTLEITVKGRPITIPANVGTPDGAHVLTLHTHEPNNVIHMEIPGPVKKTQIMLREFFKVWDKQMTSDCILDYCNGTEGTWSMLVNGTPNNEFGAYVMKDKDKIELAYE